MALTGTQDIRPGKYPIENSEHVGSGAVIYAGGCLCFNASGYLVPADESDATLNASAGWAIDSLDNSANATSASSETIKYGKPFILEMKKTYNAAHNGQNAYPIDDEEAGVLADVSNSYFMGKFCGVGTKGSSYTKIDPYAMY